MTNAQFLNNYQQMQYGIVYDQLIDLGFATIVTCQQFDSAFFNLAQVDRMITALELGTIEKTLREHQRQPAIYFEHRPDLAPLVEFLVQQGYEKTWEDSWMFHDGQGISLGDARVEKVTTIAQLATFIQTFNQCYTKDDPQNPYGELGNYLDVAREAWIQHHPTNRLEYYIIYKGDQPVAVSSLTNYAGIGYISNVGSLRSVRGQGFGRIASLYAVQQSVHNGNTEHALATEAGQYPYQFYQLIGFKTRFTALGYVQGKPVAII